MGSASFGPHDDGRATTDERGAARAARRPRRACAARAGSPATTRPPSSCRWRWCRSTPACRTSTAPSSTPCPRRWPTTAAPGVRVKVRFAGQDLDGFVLERRADAEHLGRLSPLRRVVSPEPVLTPQVLATARAVADRYAGSLGDVLRLAVPPRHATAEKALAVEAPEHPPAAASGCRSAWSPYAAGPAFLSHLTSGGAPTASLLAAPVGGRRPRLAGAARRGRPGRGRGRPRRRARRARPPRRRAGRGGAARGARPGPAHPAHRRPGAAGALHGLPQGAARPRARWSSAPGPRRSRRCATSAWSPGGTTATTCSTSRGRPTRTCARCCSPGRPCTAPRCCRPGSAGRWPSPTSSPAGC